MLNTKRLGCSNQVRLAVLDVAMPGVGGHEVARRGRLANPCLKSLLMSGCSVAAGDTGPARPEDEHLIQKPFRAEVLLRAVRRALDEPPRSED